MISVDFYGYISSRAILRLKSTLGCDPGISRPKKVHGSCMPQEYDLARLVANISNPHHTWTVENSAKSWHKVAVRMNGDVYEINWCDMGLRGSLNFALLPRTTEFLSLGKKFLSGRINIELDADKLRDLRLPENQLEGPLFLGDLPRAVVRLWVHKNRCTGPLDLTALPPTIRTVYLHDNDFSGVVSFEGLPSTIIDLALDNNRLEGNLQLGSLPRSLTSLSLYNNTFSGTLDFSQLPPLIRQVALARNHFDGDVELFMVPKSTYFVSLFLNRVTVYLDAASRQLDQLCLYDPPRKNFRLRYLPARWTKWDTSSNVWYSYGGRAPGSDLNPVERQSSKNPKLSWWTQLEEHKWVEFQPSGDMIL